MFVCKDLLNCWKRNNEDGEECIEGNKSINNDYAMERSKNLRKSKCSMNTRDYKLNEEFDNKKGKISIGSGSGGGGFVISGHNKQSMSVSSMSTPVKVKSNHSSSMSFHFSLNSSIVIQQKTLINDSNNNPNSQGNVTFIKNATNDKQSEGLNESIKQLKFTYVDDDEQETKFNTNTHPKKNSISDSKDHPTPLIVLNPIASISTANPDLKENFKITVNHSYHFESEASIEDNPQRKINTNHLHLFNNPKQKSEEDNNSSIVLYKSYSKPNDSKELNISSRENALNEGLCKAPQMKHSRTNFNLVYNHPIPSKHTSIRSTHDYTKDLIKIIVENKIGTFLNETLSIDSKGLIGCGLRKKRDGYVHFGFNQFDTKGVTINDVIINDKLINNLDSSYSDKILFTIYYDINCLKYFFQPSKEIKPSKHKTSKCLKVFFNIISSFSFISNQTFEMNNTIVTVAPDQQELALVIQVGKHSLVSVSSSKQVVFIQTSKGIEIKANDAMIGNRNGNIVFDMVDHKGNGDKEKEKDKKSKSSICILNYDKAKQLWSMIPQSINIWVLIKCKQSIEQSTLIKFGEEAIIKVTPTSVKK